MAFTMANMKNQNSIFTIIHRQLATSATQNGTCTEAGMGMGEFQPPRNRIDSRAHISTMLAYSPIMNSRYGVEEYSTWKPATSSDSASDRSKGGRLVSARAETKKITVIGTMMTIRGRFFRPPPPNTFQFQKPPAWWATMSDRFIEPACRITVRITRPIDTSYDTIWAAERRAPRNGYFEFEAQPPMITP